jgi:hypothetical protein
MDYFKNLYSQSDHNGAQLEEFLVGLSLPKISIDSHRKLQDTSSATKILGCLKEMGLDKSPDPDNFTVQFLVTQWRVIGLDIIRIIQNAFQTGRAPDQWMLSHLVLILK